MAATKAAMLKMVVVVVVVFVRLQAVSQSRCLCDSCHSIEPLRGNKRTQVRPEGRREMIAVIHPIPLADKSFYSLSLFLVFSLLEL